LNQGRGGRKGRAKQPGLNGEMVAATRDQDVEKESGFSLLAPQPTLKAEKFGVMLGNEKRKKKKGIRWYRGSTRKPLT